MAGYITELNELFGADESPIFKYALAGITLFIAGFIVCGIIALLLYIMLSDDGTADFRDRWSGAAHQVKLAPQRVQEFAGRDLETYYGGASTMPDPPRLIDMMDGDDDIDNYNKPHFGFIGSPESADHAESNNPYNSPMMPVLSEKGHANYGNPNKDINLLYEYT